MHTEGVVDIVTQVSPEKANLVRKSQYAKLINVGGNRILAGAFNRFQKDVNFNDDKLRLAFNLAINREEIIHQAFYGYAKTVPALTPPWAFDFPKDLKVRGYNPRAARELLHAAGWPSGRVLRIAAPKDYERVGQLMALHIRESLGIEVAVKIILPEEQLKWMRVVAEKRLMPNWDILVADPYALFYEGTPAYFHREFLGSDGALRAGPKLPQFESLFKAMAMQTDREELLEKAKEIDRYVYEESLVLSICAPHDLYAVNKHVDFKPYRTSFELVDTEVDERHWSRLSY